MPTDERGTFAARLDPRSNSLNAIRLLLATTVIISHSWMIGGYGPMPNHGGETPGGWSVYAFFVLSGYLITGSRLNNDLMAYLKRRFLRIYPGFLVCLLSTIVVFAPLGYYHVHHTLRGYLTAKGNTPLDFLFADLFLKMNLFKVAGTPTGPHAWTGSLWSLYFEFLCYVIVGLLGCWAVFRHRPIVAVAVFLFATVARVEHTHTAALAHGYEVTMMVRLLPWFMAGSVIYLLRDKIPCTWLLAAPCAASFVIWPLVTQDRFTVLLALPVAYVLLYVGAVVPIHVGRKNDISYGMYMYGYPIEQLMRGAHLSSHAVYTVLSILFTIPVAAASWFLIERPAMRWRRGRRAGGTPTGMDTPPTSEAVSTEQIEPAAAKV